MVFQVSQAAQRGHRRSGLTLVELLIVIAIIAILMGLLLPAVGAVREGARMAQCKNNLRQIAIGCLVHEHAQGFLPHVGGFYGTSPDPDLGFNSSQGGSWLYNILPYVERTSLHDLGAGGNATVKTAANIQRIGTTVPTFNCPTRGSGLVRRAGGGVSTFARTDYSGNVEGLMSGMVQTYAVSDGLSNVFLCGERNLDPDRYTKVNGWEGAARYDSNEMGWTVGKDHESMCRGSPHGCLNFHHPIQDTPGVASNQGCGSPAGYPNGIAYGSPHIRFHVATGGGNVLAIDYSIDDAVLSDLSRNSDGGTTDDLGD